MNDYKTALAALAHSPIVWIAVLVAVLMMLDAAWTRFAVHNTEDYDA